MRQPATLSSTPARHRAGRLAAIALLVATGAAGQSPAPATADSATLAEEAREQQRQFEQYRQSRIPVERARREGGCDRRIGRICIWFGGEGETRFPSEPVETWRARRSLIGSLLRIRERIADPWIVGQLVHYLVEEEEYDSAEQVADFCGIEAAWWCSALKGYALHVRGDVPAAEAAFRESLALMPEAERRWWTTPRYVLSGDGIQVFERLDQEARDPLWTLFWRLSDPLFLVEGNDRLTDHLARLVEVRNHVDAEHPQGMEWEEDLEETLVRYGRIVGWSRSHSPGLIRPGSRRLPPDTRRLVGHHHPMSRGYLFPEEFLESPADVPPESWITAPRVSRTWYAPPYAPDMRGLETQVGRFRRGAEMLVVGAYRPVASPAPDTGPPEPALPGPRAESALFLIPLDGAAPVIAEGRRAEGVLTLTAPPGRYVSSLEVLDRDGRRAWRARQGIHQEPLEPGQLDVSDLMILDGDAPFPERLDDAIPHVRPGIRVGRGERFTVVWEVYGLEVREPVRVTLGFTRGRPGFLARVGEFLGVIEPDGPVEVTFDEAAPDEVESVFRAMVLEFPDIRPGEYTLHLRLDRPGREPVIASRPVVVVE